MILFDKLRSTGSFNVAIITQTSIGLGIVVALFVEEITRNGILDNWKPILLVYLAYLISISPVLSKIKTKTNSLQTKKYVTARDEVIKAMKCASSNPEDVMIHIRTAIDLSIQEKFGFKKIHPMIQFLGDAKKHNLPLPSYDLIYKYFSSGSERIHSGNINTSFEVSQITRTVKEFIDELEEIKISQIEIENFKKQCKFVQ